MKTFSVKDHPSMYNLTHCIQELIQETQKAVFVQVISEKKAKTSEQNRTFHALVTCFYNSGLSSYDSHDEIKKAYKYKVRLIREYKYFNGEKLVSVTDKSDIPPEVPTEHCMAIIDSWSKATKEQAINAIIILINDMRNAGVNNKEYETIVQGFSNRWW